MLIFSRAVYISLNFYTRYILQKVVNQGGKKIEGKQSINKSLKFACEGRGSFRDIRVSELRLVLETSNGNSLRELVEILYLRLIATHRFADKTISSQDSKPSSYIKTHTFLPFFTEQILPVVFEHFYGIIRSIRCNECNVKIRI